MSLGEKLTTAINNKKNDVNSFVWRGEKVRLFDGTIHQEEVKLMDATVEDLKRFYNHCNVMLYNNDKEKPGRYVVYKMISDQRNRCNAELFLRWIEGERNLPRFKFRDALTKFLTNNKDQIEDVNQLYVSDAVGGCPEEFDSIPMNLALDGCLDRLGRFERKHMTNAFIAEQGICFSADESRDLTVKDSTGLVRDRLEVVRERLNIKPSIKLYVSFKGLSYQEFRAMITLKSKKYSELTTDQLRTLRNKVLFAFEDKVSKHIDQWEERKHQIELVCEKRNLLNVVCTTPAEN